MIVGKFTKKNVWCAMINNNLIGPPFLHGQFTNSLYLDFLQKHSNRHATLFIENSVFRALSKFENSGERIVISTTLNDTTYSSCMYAPFEK